MQAVVLLLARVLLSLLFIWSGYGRIDDYTGGQAELEALGIPGVLLPLVIVLELGGGLLLALGWQARPAALLLLAYALAVAVLTASPQALEVLFRALGHVAGLALVLQFGPGRISIDGVLSRR